MSDDPASPVAVGRQLAQRRKDLDLTQDQLAERVDVRTRTISAIETGKNSIQRSNRSTWEKALRLKPGTISRAYSEGSPIEMTDSRSHEASDTGHASDDLTVDRDPAVAKLAAEVAELREEVKALKREKAAETASPQGDRDLDLG